MYAKCTYLISTLTKPKTDPMVLKGVRKRSDGTMPMC